MKICVELDSWMEEKWKSVRSTLEWKIQYYREADVYLSDSEVLEGLLVCFSDETAPTFFGEEWFDDEEIEAMRERATNPP